jgi:hypothetical protein
MRRSSVLLAGETNPVGDLQQYRGRTDPDHVAQEPGQVLQRSRRDQSADQVVIASTTAHAAARFDIAGRAGKNSNGAGDSHAREAQVAQQQARNAAIYLQTKAQTEPELARRARQCATHL